MSKGYLLLIYLAFPLVLTLLMEIPVLIAGFRREHYSIGYKLSVFVLVNVITNLTLNTLRLITGGGMPLLFAEEVIIVVIEALVYKRAFLTSYKKSFLISFTANAFSGITGSILIRMVVQ